jgi:endoglucanase
MAWRWAPGAGVPDPNNATDGDLLLVWALLRAARAWNEPGFEREALEIARDMRQSLVRVTRHGTVLLPGAEGFAHDGVTTVNLSYWVFPALQALAAADPDPTWPALLDSGLRLVDAARFGRWGLPPDWLELTDPLQPSAGFPPRYGYDAIRIPLYLYWAGLDVSERVAPFRALSAYFRQAPFLPPWVDLRDDSVSSYDASQGIHAVYRLIGPEPNAGLPSLGADADYYSASLLLLAKLARRERAAR